MNSPNRHKGPWTHRLLVYVFAVLFGVLVYWLLGFVVHDIGTWPGPAYPDLEARMVKQTEVKDLEAVEGRIAEATRTMEQQRERQRVLRDSTGNSEKTINQLLELQRANPAAVDSRALAESQQLFLANQAKYQQLNEQITTLNETLNELQGRRTVLQKSLEEQRVPVRREFERMHAAHQWKLAAAKLAVLLPLLGLAVWLFLKRRTSLYVPLIYGFGLALLVRVLLVIHEHFPTRYFKYILILVSLALVMRILVYLLRSMAHPKPEYLLKQYREAYERFLCPVCAYPIRRGPLKYLFWTRGSLKKLRLPAGAATGPEEPYTCPVCTTRLFEPCPDCSQVRHALLPACSHCGAKTAVQSS